MTLWDLALMMGISQTILDIFLQTESDLGHGAGELLPIPTVHQELI
jgi:hypothetical protein